MGELADFLKGRRMPGGVSLLATEHGSDGGITMAKQMHTDTAKQKAKPASKSSAAMHAKGHEATSSAPGKMKSRMNKSEMISK